MQRTTQDNELQYLQSAITRYWKSHILIRQSSLTTRKRQGKSGINRLVFLVCV